MQGSQGWEVRGGVAWLLSLDPLDAQIAKQELGNRFGTQTPTQKVNT